MARSCDLSRALAARRTASRRACTSPTLTTRHATHHRACLRRRSARPTAGCPVRRRSPARLPRHARGDGAAVRPHDPPRVQGWAGAQRRGHHPRPVRCRGSIDYIFNEFRHDVREQQPDRGAVHRHHGGHPFFSNDENDMFRAVHDVYGHLAVVGASTTTVRRLRSRSTRRCSPRSHARPWRPRHAARTAPCGSTGTSRTRRWLSCPHTCRASSSAVWAVPQTSSRPRSWPALEAQIRGFADGHTS